MPQFTNNQNASLGQIGGVALATITDDIMVNEQPPAVLAAQPAVLTVRTSNTAGTLTMNNGAHGIITGQRLDLYWAGGQCFGAVAGVVAGTSVPIASVSGGSVLPAATTVINVGIPTQRFIAITGNNLSALLLTCAVSAYIVFASVAPADIANMFLSANIVYTWYTGNGVANPLAGVIVASVWVSHSSTAGPQQVNVGALFH